MKRFIRSSYNPVVLDEYVNKYSYSDLSDEVYNETHDESLADDVLEAIRPSYVGGAMTLTRSAQSCQRDCRNAFEKFDGNIPIWKLQDIYQTYKDVDRQLINMWCKGR